MSYETDETRTSPHEHMSFQDFNRMATDDIIVFYAGLILLLENGSTTVSTWDEEQAMPKLKRQYEKLFGDKIIREVFHAAQAFASIKPRNLIAYIKNCDCKASRLKSACPYDKEGICPVCYADIVVDTFDTFDGADLIKGWRCPKCGATGEERYQKTFDRHYNVRDEHGKAIEYRPE